MNATQHVVSGIYADRAEAETVREALIKKGFPVTQLHIAHAAGNVSHPQMQRDDEVLKDVAIDGAIGTAVGAGLGVLAEVALVAESVSLFVASPLIGPLAMLGWGAALGGLVGAAIGAEKPRKTNGKLSELVLDAIRAGHAVLIAQVRTPMELAQAKQVIGSSLVEPREFPDVPDVPDVH